MIGAKNTLLHAPKPPALWPVWRLLVPCLWLVVVALSLPALALDNQKTAVTLVQLAAKAYEAGDFAKAADQYAKAWKLDPQPSYLWALARAEHLATILDLACEHYRAFIALPVAEPARVAKARQYLAEAEQELLQTQTRAAEAAEQAGRPAQAALIWLGARKAMPGRLELLFKAAVAEQMAEQWQSALQHQEEFLALAAANAPDRPQAVARQVWLRQKLGLAPQAIAVPAAAPVPPPISPPPATAPLPISPPPATAPSPATASVSAAPAKVTPPAPSPAGPVAPTAVAAPAPGARWPAWTVLGAGGALAVGGAVLLIATQPDAKAITAAQQHADGEWIAGLSYEEAAAKVQSVNTRLGIGWALVGTGAAAAGVGVWLLVRSDAGHSVLLPTANGAVWLVQF